MSKLDKKLTTWVEQKFITTEQATLIKDFEAHKNESPWIMTGLLILGALVVGIGIISIIAANWSAIPSTVKLCVDFLILSLLAGFTFHYRFKNMSLHFEPLLFLFMLACLASIGLIAQIYNTGGHLYEAVLLWSLITSGAMLLSRLYITPLIWTGAFILSLSWTITEASPFRNFFENNNAAIYMTVTLLCSSLAWGLNALLKSSSQEKAFHTWFFLMGIFSLGIIEVYPHIPHIKSSSLVPYFPVYLLAAFSLWGVWLQSSFTKIIKMSLSVGLTLYLLMGHIILTDFKSDFIYALFVLFILSSIALTFAGLKKRRLFSLALFFIGLRFLVLYFQAFGGLATTGVGLIISGLIIILMAGLWNKYRTQLAEWAEGWAK